MSLWFFRGRTAAVVALLIGFAVSLTVATWGFRQWLLRQNRVGLDGAAPLAESAPTAPVPADELRQIEEWLSQLMNAERSGDAAKSLREHLVKLNHEKAPHTPTAMMVVVDGIAKRIAKLDSETRSAAFSFMAESVAWHGENASPGWTGLLAPVRQIVRDGLSDSDRQSRVRTLRFARKLWSWSPRQLDEPSHRKALGTWKSDLHAMCQELLKASDPVVRAEAVTTVAAVPIDEAAGRALPLLHDPHHDVRRAVLIGLAERPDVLASEEVLTLAHDPNIEVRTTAVAVLDARGLSPVEVTLGTMSTHPKPQIRVQAARHIAATPTVDRAVWLVQLSRDADASVRAEAARALAAVGDESCREGLAQMVRADTDPALRSLANELFMSGGMNPPPTDEPHIPAVTQPRAN